MANYFLNKTNKAKFTQMLAELVCNKKCGLQSALELLSRNKNKKGRSVTLAAKNINESLLEGMSFSNALKICPAIDFDLVYISFMRFAERCGCLEKALDFLNKKCMREQQNTVKLVEASLYPAFVIVLAIFAGIFLFSYSSSLLGLKDFSYERKQDFYSSLIMAFLFLIVFCVIAFLVLRRTLGTNKLYEAFLATGFLVKGGESLANAVMNAVNILGYESKEGQLFAKAGENLSYGMSLKNSFELSDYFGSNSLRCELEEAFFYAENSGGENDVFEKIALWLNSRDEKRRAICFKLIEPFFISGTGIFLLVFLANFVLPFMTGTTLLM